jgi:hypothetical protein
MGQVLNPVCWLPRALQVHQTHEDRHFWLVSKDGAHFRTAPSAQAELTASQQDDLSRYAVDRTSVYYNIKKLKVPILRLSRCSSQTEFSRMGTSIPLPAIVDISSWTDGRSRCLIRLK